MVMAAEPGKSGIEEESLSLTNKTLVPKTKICTNSIPAEDRNGIAAHAKLDNKLISVENNEREDEPTIEVDVVAQNGETATQIKEEYLPEDDCSNNNLKSDVSPSHRDQLLLLHLDLIERQQQLIQEKDKEILQLKNEKEQVWLVLCYSEFFWKISRFCLGIRRNLSKLREIFSTGDVSFVLEVSAFVAVLYSTSCCIDWIVSLFGLGRETRTNYVTVSSIHIWSKNFSHSSMQKSEAKYGGNWRSCSTSVSGPCAKISLNGISIFPRRGLELTYYTHTIRLFTPSISAIFGFTFSNQVLTPDIYGAHCYVIAQCACF